MRLWGGEGVWGAEEGGVGGVAGEGLRAHRGCGCGWGSVWGFGCGCGWGEEGVWVQREGCVWGRIEVWLGVAWERLGVHWGSV